MASPPDPSSMTPAELDAFMNGPAFAPPPGVIPNFIDPPNNNAAAIATICCSLILTSSFALLYTYSRACVVKRLLISDLIALAGLGTYLGLIVMLHKVMTHGGFFVHQWNLRVKDMPAWTRYYKNGVILYIFSAMLVRQAILLQWVIIFVPQKTRNAFWWICYATIIVNTAFYVTAGVIAIVPEGAKIHGFDLASASMNVFFDVLIFLLPQRVIWKLNMPLKQKLRVSFAFALGLLACTSAIVRVVITAMKYHRDEQDGGPQEQTMFLSLVCLLATCETTFGILVYTVTGLPKALTSLGVTKAAFYMVSWLRSSADRILTSGKSSSGYRDVDEGSLVAMELQASGQPSEKAIAPTKRKDKTVNDDGISTTSIGGDSMPSDANYMAHSRENIV